MLRQLGNDAAEKVLRLLQKHGKQAIANSTDQLPPFRRDVSELGASRLTAHIVGPRDHRPRTPRSVGAALASLGGEPRQWIRHWNWKAALTSSLVRGSLFFFVNLTASLAAAQAALLTELLLRANTSGFYGAVTQRFRHVEPRWAATATVSLLLPIMSQTIELGVHWLRGTEALLLSVAASALLTVGSSAFNLHADGPR